MKYPGRLEITTNIGCKCNCAYCPQQLLVSRYFKRDKGRQAAGMMTLETFRICMDKLPEDTRIDFSGMAEPWLNPECTNMLLYAHRCGFPIAVYTTLMGMTETDYQKIRELPLEELVVHIPDDQGHTQIAVDQAYRKLLEKIMHDTKDGMPIVTGVSCHVGIHPSLQAVISEKSRFITEIHDRAGNLKSENVKSKVNKGQITCINCGTDMNHNVLLPDGTVLLCCMDYGMKHILGNLIEQSYEEILHAAEAKRVRQGMSDEGEDILCRDCINGCNLEEVFDEYVLYKGWNQKLVAGERHRLKEAEDYKQWVENLLVQNQEIRDENERLMLQYEERLKELYEYQDWVKNLQKQIEELSVI